MTRSLPFSFPFMCFLEKRNHKEALVRWLGFDRLLGAPHADTWELRADLTADLREGGRTVPKRNA